MFPGGISPEYRKVHLVHVEAWKERKQKYE